MTVLASVSARRSDVVALVGLGACAAAALVGTAVISTTDYGTWAPLWIGPVLVALSVPALRRQAERDGDHRLLWVFLAALLLKFVFSGLRFYFAMAVYGGGADAVAYDRAGAVNAAAWRDLRPPAVDGGLVGTGFVQQVTGLVYAVTGRSFFGGFLVFAWLAFWGQFRFYRAFRLAVPDGRRALYLGLVLFLPSVLYWPSSIGKESLMLLSLGTAAFGAARLLSGERSAAGILHIAGGLWLGAMIRPHVVALFAGALAVGALVRRTPSRHGQFGPFVKAGLLAATVGFALVIAGDAIDYLDDSIRGQEMSTVETLEATQLRTAKGGSEFQARIVRGPADFPFAAVNVLFRPHVLEAHNLQALMSAAETSVLLVLALWSLRRLFGVARHARQYPYALATAAFSALFIVAYSSIANFAILARQRSQLLPFFCVLLAMPAAARAAEGADR